MTNLSFNKKSSSSAPSFSKDNHDPSSMDLHKGNQFSVLTSDDIEHVYTNTINASQLPSTLKNTTQITQDKNNSSYQVNSSDISIQNTSTITTEFVHNQPTPLPNSSTSSHTPQEEYLSQPTFLSQMEELLCNTLSNTFCYSPPTEKKHHIECFSPTKLHSNLINGMGIDGFQPDPIVQCQQQYYYKYSGSSLHVHTNGRNTEHVSESFHQNPWLFQMVAGQP